MQTNEPIKLSRDCEVTLIPAGTKTTLKAGSTVKITQSLGGNFTVLSEDGSMVQIAGRDAGALGLDVPAEAKAPDTSEGPLEELVWN